MKKGLILLVCIAIVIIGVAAYFIFFDQNSSGAISEAEHDDSIMRTPVEESEIAQDEYGGQIVGDRLNIIMEDGFGITEAEDIARNYNARVCGYIKDAGIVQIRFNEFPGLDGLSDAIAGLEQENAVLYAMYDYVMEPGMEPNDPWGSGGETWDEDDPEGNNWGLEAIHMLSAWEQAGDTSAVKVGVIDMGFDITHEDLNILEAKDNDPLSEDAFNKIKNNKHGTHVCGTIGAVSNNGIGISGIVPNCGIAVARILDDHDILMSLLYFKKLDIKIINASLGVTRETAKGKAKENDLEWLKRREEYYSSFLKAFTYGNDILIVGSAGNCGIDAKWEGCFACVDDPVLKQHIIVVGNMTNERADEKYIPAGDTDYGRTVDIFAPGTGILSTVTGNEYELMSGTSMAAPHVTGVAAFLQSIDAGLSCTQIKRVIMDGCTGILNCHDGTYGILDASQAVAIAKGAAQRALPPLDVEGAYVSSWVSPSDNGYILLANGKAYFADKNLENPFIIYDRYVYSAVCAEGWVFLKTDTQILACKEDGSFLCVIKEGLADSSGGMVIDYNKLYYADNGSEIYSFDLGTQETEKQADVGERIIGLDDYEGKLYYLMPYEVESELSSYSLNGLTVSEEGDITHYGPGNYAPVSEYALTPNGVYYLMPLGEIDLDEEVDLYLNGKRYEKSVDMLGLEYYDGVIYGQTWYQTQWLFTMNMKAKNEKLLEGLREVTDYAYEDYKVTDGHIFIDDGEFIWFAGLDGYGLTRIDLPGAAPEPVADSEGNTTLEGVFMGMNEYDDGSVSLVIRPEDTGYTLSIRVSDSVGRELLASLEKLQYISVTYKEVSDDSLGFKLFYNEIFSISIIG